MAKAKPISAKWRKLFKLIPGYDPIKTAPPGAQFDERVADVAVSFFAERMSHVEGALAGKPFVLQPWQAAHVGCAFGWKMADGMRRYREVFDYEPRGNGKTAKAAGLLNLVAFCDDEPGAQIYSAASDREQAALVFRQARGMLVNRPELGDQCRIFASMKSIEYPQNTIYKALSSESETKHGFNTHFLIFDELHAQTHSELLEVLMTSTGKRRQPMIWYITTADYKRESVCNEKYDYACKVRDGIINDPKFLPVIFEASAQDNWRDPAVWRKANPNLGITIPLEYMERECLRAQTQPTFENTFKRLHLNVRTEQDVRWIPMAQWDDCGQPFELAALANEPAWAGLDFGWRDDMAALVLVIPRGDEVFLLPRFWLPKQCRRDLTASPMREFLAQGLVELTEGNSTDVECIYAALEEYRKRYDLQGVALDPANARKQEQDLQANGYTVMEFLQSKKSYNEPCLRFAELVRSGKLRHGGHPVLRWMASNVEVELNGLNQIMPKKRLSAEKIDGIVAAIMGLGMQMFSPQPKRSVYETRGLLRF
jgi:phage terminase large subunit-like protein